MNYIRAALLLALIVAGILFGTTNTQPASITFFNFSTKAYPLYMLILIAFIAGTVAAFAYNILSESEMKSRLASAKKNLKDEEEKLKVFQKEKAKTQNQPLPDENAQA